MTRPIFSEKTKGKIFERDGWRCTMCGNGRREGEDIAVWFLEPWECGEKATVENGTTLCTKHFFLVQQYGAIEAVKMMFEENRGESKKENNAELVDFTSDILKVFEKYDMNGHIVWKK